MGDHIMCTLSFSLSLRGFHSTDSLLQDMQLALAKLLSYVLPAAVWRTSIRLIVDQQSMQVLTAPRDVITCGRS